jgi:hypothetical protein
MLRATASSSLIPFGIVGAPTAASDFGGNMAFLTTTRPRQRRRESRGCFLFVAQELGASSIEAPLSKVANVADPSVFEKIDGEIRRIEVHLSPGKRFWGLQRIEMLSEAVLIRTDSTLDESILFLLIETPIFLQAR